MPRAVPAKITKLNSYNYANIEISIINDYKYLTEKSTIKN